MCTCACVRACVRACMILERGVCNLKSLAFVCMRDTFFPLIMKFVGRPPQKKGGGGITIKQIHDIECDESDMTSI